MGATIKQGENKGWQSAKKTTVGSKIYVTDKSSKTSKTTIQVSNKNA